MRRTAKCNSLCVGTTKCTSRRMVHMVDSIARCTESAHNEPAIVSSRFVGDERKCHDSKFGFKIRELRRLLGSFEDKKASIGLGLMNDNWIS
jgi:hypothetical protein